MLTAACLASTMGLCLTRDTCQTLRTEVEFERFHFKSDAPSLGFPYPAGHPLYGRTRAHSPGIKRLSTCLW